MPRHIMLDLETLDVTPSAVVLSIGAVAFNPNIPNGLESAETFYRRIEVGSQLAVGRTTSQPTIDWWKEQSDEARAVFDEPEVSTEKALHDFVRFVGEAEYVWGNGAEFDNAIMNSLLRSYKMEPLSFRMAMCFRTIVALDRAIDRPTREPRLVHHNALDDAIFQTVWLYRIVEALNLKF